MNHYNESFNGKCPTCGQEWRGWIPCAERMPEDGQWVLAGSTWDKEVYRSRHSGGYWDVLGLGTLLGSVFTHWMPLPEGPR